MGKPVEVRVLSRAKVSWPPRWRLVSQLLSAKRQRQPERRSANPNRLVYFLAAAFFLAAQRAFINWESRFRPAGVIPPFFLAGAVLVPAFSFAQRALAAAASLARVTADIRRRPSGVATPAGGPPRIEERRFSRLSICRRIETASCKASIDISIPCQIAGVSSNGNQLFNTDQMFQLLVGALRPLLLRRNNSEKAGGSAKLRVDIESILR